MPQYLGLNISDEIADAIAKRTAETGESKTTIATIALEKELGIQKNATLGDRVDIVEVELKDLKQKVSDIEKRLDAD
jgi:hypothetical protein